MASPKIIINYKLSNQKCHYCNNPAKFAFESGRFCCESHHNKCPSIKNKNSSGLKIAHKENKFLNKKLNPSRENQYSKAIRLGLPKPTISLETRKRMSLANSGRKLSQERKDVLSENAKLRGLGGVRQSRKILYKGYLLGSSYELKLVQVLEELNIEWTVPTKFRYTSPDGKIRTYQPDIYIPKYNLYFDPKNDFLIKNINPRLGFKDVDKINWVMEQNNIQVIILSLEMINLDFILKILEPQVGIDPTSAVYKTAASP